MTTNENMRLAAFLKFLGKDIERQPGRLSPLVPELAMMIAGLVAGVDCDIDALIEGNVILFK